MGRGGNRQGFKTPWETQPQLCCQHWGSGKKECGELWEMLLQTPLSQCRNSASLSTGHLWACLGQGQPSRTNVAQQKGWEKQKPSRGQDPHRALEIVQDSQNLNHAVWNLLPTASIPVHTGYPSPPALLSHRKN